MSAFLRPRPVPDPDLRLVAFHHAGGSSSAYFPLSRGIPQEWDLLLPDLPGRGRRHRDEPLRDIPAMVARVVEDLRDWADAPLALFGHSLGAVVAAETARALGVHGVAPVWLGVSGRPAPGYRGPKATLPYDVSDDEMLRHLFALGGMPDRIHEVPEFRAQLLRLVRADLGALAGYAPPGVRPPLAVPMTAFGGTEDDWAPPPAMAAWAGETSAPFRRLLFPGGHFHFLGAAFGSFTAALVAEVRAATRSTSRSRPTPGVVAAGAASPPV
ncbi:alpha/beta fold hydrolase [Micromonospora yasonensis]|uniref:thioesterase II family protein n=1 Tax=Micromonospora yasonensis TaxID=1128667 RepID=UPI00222F2496|nr:alpha/beta fold hydrolase [Micromonospora yasonensis]MCW3844423.1 alpha/beta fold hydrolase [Micromonospora yasonensis]